MKDSISKEEWIILLMSCEIGNNTGFLRSACGSFQGNMTVRTALQLAEPVRRTKKQTFTAFKRKAFNFKGLSFHYNVLT